MIHTLRRTIKMTNLTFNKEELEAILYSLEGYIQGNDDNKLCDELVDICYKIEGELAEQSNNDYVECVDHLVSTMGANSSDKTNK